MSSSEIAFQKIIDGNGFPFYFNGTLSKEGRRVLIGRKIPDFVHNTEKKIIEIYGDKPHANPKIFKKEYITPNGRVAKDVWELDEKRVSFIKSQGYQVLIIWASELKKHFEIEEMVKRFVNND
jgi:very-short-patch-repair endonuclease